MPLLSRNTDAICATKMKGLRKGCVQSQAGPRRKVNAFRSGLVTFLLHIVF